MILDLPMEIMLRLFTGYLVIVGYFIVCGWLLYRMRVRVSEAVFKRQMEDTERLYGGQWKGGP